MNKFVNGISFNSSLFDISPSFLYRWDLFEESLLKDYVTLHIFTSFDKAFYKVSSKWMKLLSFQKVFCGTFNGRAFHLTELKDQSKSNIGQEISNEIITHYIINQMMKLSKFSVIDCLQKCFSCFLFETKIY